MSHLLVSELRLTLRILFRQPGFWVPTVLFPAMLYAFFGANMAAAGGMGAYAMASFAIYAVVGVGFYQFGVSVAQDRESPFTVWQRSLPGHAMMPWVARIAASLLFVLIAVGLVLLAGWQIGGITLTAPAYARLALACAVSAVPATLLGTALGSVASSRAAVPLANLIFLPLSYLGGLWVPPVALPAAINAISVWTPTRAMGEIAWAALDGRALSGQYATVLLGWALLAGAVTWVAQRRHARALFG
ncbi:ABC transporter permease [Pararhodobacter sp.]|uniref:ABC transporter permease n=1 Tax=Pararhodobacter sp. TaxID=2127056 RepID=UPI002AFEFCAD|nr:ABC transporter permease [Pararhodobacter sp.]